MYRRYQGLLITMTPFTSLTSVAAPLPEGDVDTDIIFPARFLLLLSKDGLAEQLFHERRRAKGQPKFVLDTPPFDRAKILVVGENFGCGSSREHAVWAIADFGIRAILAPSFGEIFFNNCLKNGVLPIVMDRLAHARAMKAAFAEQPLTVDLEARTVSLGDGETIGFEMDAFARRMILLGLDEIGMILAEDQSDIVAFEARQRSEAPWLDLADGRLDVLRHAIPGDARDDR
jgi:3-isopropylmalate/(R)-2-methylmalate dehydratase small subunit